MTDLIFILFCLFILNSHSLPNKQVDLAKNVEKENKMLKKKVNRLCINGSPLSMNLKTKSFNSDTQSLTKTRIGRKKQMKSGRCGSV